MKQEELRLCQIQEWYPLFKPHSIPTLFHPLPDDFLLYILGDPPAAGDPSPPFLLPLPSSGQDPLPRPSLDPISTLDSDPSSFHSDSNSDSDSDSESPLPPSFPSLESAVNQSISSLGGSVFPKLNWSSPKDAAWIAADGTLRCASFPEIALLLRSSDRAVHDLCHAAPSCSDHGGPPFAFVLALRKFYGGLRPEMEFRCFVRGRRLVGICQREVTAFYPSLVGRRGELGRVLGEFFDEVVWGRFGLEDYCFDVYVRGDGRVKVLDFNPWGGFTLPLLFGWEELEGEGFGGEEEEVVFRLVDGRCGVRPGLKTAVPYDYLDTGEGSGWDEFLRRADDELRRQIKDSEVGNFKP